jgi:SAM-dependent methyltransferase
VSALERALPLLEADARPAESAAPDGYLDLLGGAGPASTGTAFDLMNTGIVPRIYERYWRPGLGRLAKGVLGPSMKDEHRIARLLLGLTPGDGVLDVACGPGNFTRTFGEAVGADGLAAGLDASRTMLAQAAREPAAPSVVYVRGDAGDLPFRDGSFDAVCCFAALYLIEDPMRAIAEIVRVTAPGGRVALLSSVNRGPAPAGLADAVVRPITGIRVFGRDDLTGALREHGLADVQRHLAGFAQFVSARRP